MSHYQPPAEAGHARGFSLLEVILALAILAGAMAVLGEVIHLARDRAVDCQAQTRGQILAATVMDEIASGLREMTAEDRVPLETDSQTPWVCTISMPSLESEQEDLVVVEVVVEQDLDQSDRPAKVRLMRWFHMPEQEDGASQEGGNAGGGASSGTSGGARG